MSTLLATELSTAAAQPAAARQLTDPSSGPSGVTSSQPAQPSAVSDRVKDPDKTLPADWRTSKDRAVTVAGDGSGLHVMVADSKDAYAWREVTTLSEPGLTEDQWVGNACLTGSGTRAVVSYAPRAATNDTTMFERGAFVAVVDLTTGKVTKLPVTTTLAYFSPGCGAGETAVLTQENGANGQTRLVDVDAVSGAVGRILTVPGQITSAVPAGDRIVAAHGSTLTQIDQAGAEHPLATTSGAPFDLHPDASGAVVFVDQAGSTASVKRIASGTVSTLATGPYGTVGATAGSGGRVFITGKQTAVRTLPAGIAAVATDPAAVVSSEGRLTVTSAAPADLAQRITMFGAARTDASVPAPIVIHAHVDAPSKGKAAQPDRSHAVDFTVASETTTAADSGTAPSPALLRSAPAKVQAAVAGSASDPVDADRYCSIARNDARTQVYQPTPNQIEWAVDDAVRGVLTVQRPVNWKGSGMPVAWQPQGPGMFPNVGLVGANGMPLTAPNARVPAQVLLGVLAQESNLWQASGHVLPGQYGNPLVANFYGTKVSASPGFDPGSWAVNWASADCGYGVGQVTDGMRTAGDEKPGEVAKTPNQQLAIATDYATNIAASLTILEAKWNELHMLAQPITLNDDDPSKLENWFAALWDYNEGFNPPTAGSTAWGLGWANNPANPNFPANRHAFLDGNTYSDAASPQNWPYEEKVLGWAAWPIDTGNSYDDTGLQNNGNTHGYQAAWWNSSDYRSAVKPPLNTFCDTSNGCDVSNPPVCKTVACYQSLWYHQSTTWKAVCSIQCGGETMTYKTLRSEPGDAHGTTSYPTTADCATSTLPAGTAIVTTVPDSVPMHIACASGTRTATDAGTFAFSFTGDTSGNYEAKEDLHQLTAGFGGHIWFAHTRNQSDGGGNEPATTNTVLPASAVPGNLTVTGTWTPNQRLNGWVRVLVHIPDTAAVTQQAHYTIYLGDGTKANRVIDTHLGKNSWISLGTFQFIGNGWDTPRVSLDNTTFDGTGTQDIAWDAMGFQSLPAKPKDFVVQLGDSYTSGEGAEPYLPGSDVGPYANQISQSSSGDTWNACHRSQNSWIRKTTLPGRGAAIGALADSFDPSVDFQSVACSGAYTWEMDPATSSASKWGTNGEFHEVQQLTAGTLDANTTLVALTAGGNDAGFSGTIQSCSLLGCPSDASVKANIDGVAPSLTALLQHIAALAPNAKIVLLGYPKLFGSGGTCGGSLDAVSAVQIDAWADYMSTMEANATATAAAKGAHITYWGAETGAARFEGYRVCGPTTSGINAVVAAPATKGGGDFSCCVSRESYHPNNTGTDRYALTFKDALFAAGYYQP